MDDDTHRHDSRWIDAHRRIVAAHRIGHRARTRSIERAGMYAATYIYTDMNWPDADSRTGSHVHPMRSWRGPINDTPGDTMMLFMLRFGNVRMRCKSEPR